MTSSHGQNFMELSAFVKYSTDVENKFERNQIKSNQYGVSIKMTNVVCISYNKSWVVVNHCRLKAVQRNKTIFNADLEIIHPANEIDMRVQVQKKANGYKPWLFDITIDGCKYLRKPNNPAIKIIYGIFKEFSTINHTCPYVGHQGVAGFYPTIDKFPNPLPSGDYFLILTFILSKQRIKATDPIY
ncbi:uncharacterized protein LOC115483355 [Drosophila hydei]|uniref:Uncharacterized protein LOC115483355 n=1 Tax=Drosophila hydei TaxID=7224 RepID=A0A6J2SY54_DROHY|nr:uncharacterized protein LOC115483355 [Drosophila hydei]